MTTAVDTNILLDVFTDDPKFGRASAAKLRECLTKGQLIVSDIVWAETAAAFADGDLFRHVMKELSVKFVPMTEADSSLAGMFWRRKQARSYGKRVLADFLIAAHAINHADALLTRDRGFYRAYFSRLSVIEP